MKSIMQLGCLLALLTGCISASAQARGAFSAKYGCTEDKVTTLDLGQPAEGENIQAVEARGCGYIAKYTCAYYTTHDDGAGYTCTDESQRATFQATDSTAHATSPDAALASAANDLACAPKDIVRVSDSIFEGCGQRVAYQVVANDVPTDPPGRVSQTTRMRFVLIGRLPLQPK